MDCDRLYFCASGFFLGCLRRNFNENKGIKKKTVNVSESETSDEYCLIKKKENLVKYIICVHEIIEMVIIRLVGKMFAKVLSDKDFIF